MKNYFQTLVPLFLFCYLSLSTNILMAVTIGSQNNARAIGIQADGKIVAAGFSTINSVNQYIVARYSSAGVLDAGSFSSNGVITTSIGTDAKANAIAIQTDNKIVVAGYAFSAGVNQFAVVRYNTDGSLDG